MKHAPPPGASSRTSSSAPASSARTRTSTADDACRTALVDEVGDQAGEVVAGAVHHHVGIGRHPHLHARLLAATLTAAANAGETPDGRAAGSRTGVPATSSCPHTVKVVEKDGKLLADDGSGLRELKPGDRVRAVPAIPAKPGADLGAPGTAMKGTIESAPDAPEKGTTESGTTERVAPGKATREKGAAEKGMAGHRTRTTVAVACAVPPRAD
ncbi:hypothetical protein [Microbispora sp. CA-102843]|uniref:hypothetical protein n=1 Tax=Microbispora sp. CA-102843 TaxID=3239952 RepID=UPI003D8A3192